jgi:hypothetical protein
VDRATSGGALGTGAGPSAGRVEQPVVTDPMASGQPDIRRGGCSAWMLPPDETCAGVARSLVRETLATLGLPRGLIQDVALIASELSTNAYLHALGGRAAHQAGADIAALPELWLYQRARPVPEMVCKVFDPLRSAHPATLRSGRPGPLAENGRGLAIVDGLATDWGVELTRCRLGQRRVPGKAVWAAVQFAPTYSRPPLPNPPRAYAVEELCAALVQRGVTGVRRMHSAGVSLVSVRRGLTVWARDAFSWQDPAGRYVRYQFRDIVEVTEQVIRLHEELAARQGASGHD